MTSPILALGWRVRQPKSLSPFAFQGLSLWPQRLIRPSCSCEQGKRCVICIALAPFLAEDPPRASLLISSGDSRFAPCHPRLIRPRPRHMDAPPSLCQSFGACRAWPLGSWIFLAASVSPPDRNQPHGYPAMGTASPSPRNALTATAMPGLTQAAALGRRHWHRCCGGARDRCSSPSSHGLLRPLLPGPPGARARVSG